MKNRGWRNIGHQAKSQQLEGSSWQPCPLKCANLEGCLELCTLESRMLKRVYKLVMSLDPVTYADGEVASCAEQTVGITMLAKRNSRFHKIFHSQDRPNQYQRP